MKKDKRCNGTKSLMQRAFCVVVRSILPNVAEVEGLHLGRRKIVETSGYHITLDISYETFIKANILYPLCLAI